MDARTLRHSLTLRARLSRPGGFSLDVDADFLPGVTVLFGPSGAGKSTVLDILAGLVTPDAGKVTLGERVFYDGSTGNRVPVHARRVAYVFQSLALFPHRRVLANVAYGIPRGQPKAVRDSLAMDFLRRFSAEHLAGRYPATLSGGEAQRVALARAVAMQPRALLLDEPFAALDHALRESFTQEVRSLGESLGIPIVHVTHDRREALALGGRILRLESGRVTAQGGADVLSLDGTSTD